MSDEQQDVPTAILEHPFLVVDGVVGEVLRNNFPQFRLRWKQHTSGSSRHTVTDQSNRELFQIWVRAIRLSDTVLSVIAAPDLAQPVEFGVGLVRQILHQAAMDQVRLDEMKRQIFPETTSDPQAIVAQTVGQRDSARYAHPSYKQRQNIVGAYFEAKKKGEAQNRDTWAQMHHGICGKTLGRYIKELKTDTK